MTRKKVAGALNHFLWRGDHTKQFASLEDMVMGDLTFINLLREKFRQLEAEDKRTAAFGTATIPHRRFVRWIMPAQSRPQSAPRV
jgi:hypothetical protein